MSTTVTPNPFGSTNPSVGLRSAVALCLACLCFLFTVLNLSALGDINRTLCGYLLLKEPGNDRDRNSNTRNAGLTVVLILVAIGAIFTAKDMFKLLRLSREQRPAPDTGSQVSQALQYA
jgi:hypothetical protein